MFCNGLVEFGFNRVKAAALDRGSGIAGGSAGNVILLRTFEPHPLISDYANVLIYLVLLIDPCFQSLMLLWL